MSVRYLEGTEEYGELEYEGEIYRELDMEGIRVNSYYVSRSGEVYTTIRKRLLSPSNSGRRYKQVGLVGDIGNSTSENVHVLVAHVYLGERPFDIESGKYCVVHHKDEDKLNNNLSNLEYITPAQNVRKSLKGKITEEVAYKIWEMNVLEHKGIQKISSELGLPYRSVERVLYEETWKGIREPDWSYRSPYATEDEVREMRRMWEEGGVSHSELGKMFNRSVSSVSSIVNYRTWKDVV